MLDVDDLVGGGNENDPDLDAKAEKAAIRCFGTTAAAVSGRPPRRSTLVAENSAIDGTYTRYGCACCSSFVDYSMMYSILLFVNCSFQSHGLHPGVS